MEFGGGQDFVVFVFHAGEGNFIVCGVLDIFSDRLPDNSTKAAIRDRLIGEARESLGRLFPNLIFEGVGNPLERGTFYFTKGNAKNWK